VHSLPTVAGPVGSLTTRLVVIRGSSGSGKSSVAAAIRAARPDRTVAIVGQDLLRRDVLGTGDDTDGHATGLVELTTRYLLDRGFDVVLEGILNAHWYGDVLRRLVDDHRGTTRCYLYDLSFDETVRRHATKPVADVFGERELRTWWRGCQPVDGLPESRVTDGNSLDETVSRVIADCWPSR
jgi:predicted kinase